MSKFSCYYCPKTSDSLHDIVNHHVTDHFLFTLKIKEKVLDAKSGKWGLQTKDFNFIPHDVLSANNCLKCNEETCEVFVQESEEDLEESFGNISLNDEQIFDTNSPFFKKVKCSTPDTRGKKLVVPEFKTDQISDEQIELVNLLPEVIEQLKKADQLQNWIALNKLIAEEKFPFSNLSFLLFMDVVRFLSLENSSAMRYDEKIKQFWKVGYRLFHGKWLRFMSGPKHTGTILTGENEKGDYNPGNSQINFVVPQRSIVSQTDSPIAAKDVRPGILHNLFDKFADQSEPEKTYKLCVDGKKINSSLIGKHGDIDLWGHESSPTITERRESFNVDIETIEKCSKYIQNKQQYITSFEELSSLEKENVACYLKTIITLITKRLHALRENVLLKEANKDKLINSIIGDWRKSRLVFVISGLITHLYDMKACIRNMLRDIDDLCIAIAHLNDSKVWIDGTFPLKNCREHITISSVDDLEREDSDTFRYIEQRSPAWHLVRMGAKITGSTMFNGLALGTLKSQLDHYDSVVFKKTKPEPASSVKEKMQYGVDNEKHALATFAGKFLPIFHTNLCYFEEGCYSIRTGNNVEIVISPDGSCRESAKEQATFGVECKCPFPGKTYATSVHYAIPKYYVPQILSEMRCLETNHLYFVSYSKESTTIQRASFHQELWTLLEQESAMIYDDNSSRPTRKSPTSKTILEQIAQYVKSNVELIAEMRSIKGEYSVTASGCESGTCTSDFHIESLIEILSSITNDVQKAYNLTRTKASELLAFMISDLDREYSFEQLHSVPVAYGLKGYSLPISALREMIDTVLAEGAKRGLYTPVCSFDGQWSRIAVRDRHDRPLTVLQLQKEVFRECRKLSKPEIIRLMSSRNIVKSSEIETKEDLSRLVGFSNRDKSITLWSNSGEKAFLVSSRTERLLRERFSCTVRNIERDEALDAPESVSEIMTLLPASVVSQMDDALVNEVQCIEQRTVPTSTKNTPTSDLDNIQELFTEENEPETPNTDQPEEIEVPDTTEQKRLLNDNDIISMLDELKGDTKANKQSKWMISVTDLESKMENACEINKNFNAYELQLCLKPIIGKLKSSGIKVKKSDTKHSHVNLFSQLFGDKSELPSRSSKKVHKLQSLTSLCKNSLQKIPKEKLNIVLAENLFPQKLEQWYNSCPYGKTIKIEGTSSVNRKQWYSYPEMNESLGFYVFFILDAYHQLCGLRRLLCASGIPEAGISNKPIHKVAEESEFNGCGLNVALVKDLIDKQSVAYAVQTFSGKVESALTAIGAHAEAKFCALVRNWYEAEDDPGIPAMTRVETRLQFRDWLLDNVNFGEFPPFGASVKGIPIILYEGLLTGIERRIQLFPLVKSGMYNVRCVGSLDVENFFGGFQDYDPWGTGVLRPDSIPTAISVAAELQEARLDPNRVFHMHTSSSKVYPSNTYHMNMELSSSGTSVPQDLSNIVVRDHGFDKPERARGARKRKRGTISKPEEPASKPLSVREYHRAHESKVLPHVRRGLVLE